MKLASQPLGAFAITWRSGCASMERNGANWSPPWSRMKAYGALRARTTSSTNYRNSASLLDKSVCIRPYSDAYVEILLCALCTPLLSLQMSVPPLHHVMIAIPVEGETRARDFYIRLLNLVEVPKPTALASRGGLWLSSGSLDIHLGTDPQFVPARKAHIALIFEDLGQVVALLTSAGHTASRVESELPGLLRCYVDDPFGNRIELMQSL